MTKDAEKLTDTFNSRFAKWDGRDDCSGMVGMTVVGW